MAIIFFTRITFKKNNEKKNQQTLSKVKCNNKQMTYDFGKVV